MRLGRGVSICACWNVRRKLGGRPAAPHCSVTPTCPTQGTVIQNLVLSWDLLNLREIYFQSETFLRALYLDISLTGVKGFQLIPSCPGQATRAWAQSSSLSPQRLRESEQYICLLLIARWAVEKGVVLLFLKISCMSFVPGWACPCMHATSPHNCSA